MFSLSMCTFPQLAARTLALLLPLSPTLRAASYYGAWETTYSPVAVPGQGQVASQFPHAIGMDSRGNVFVTGHAINGSSKEFYTAKYDALDGRKLWEAKVSGGGTSEYIANALAIDKDGNCVVTGSRNLNGSIDYYTIKYRGTDGAPFWNVARTYDGSAQGADVALKVVTDNAGDVFVTGQSAGSGSGQDIVTVKYRGSDGASLGAVDRYSTAGTRDDFPAALVTDGTNVIVAGTATPASGSRQLYVRKLNTSLSFVWQLQPLNLGGDGGATAMALDASGNAIVTAPVLDAQNRRGFYTVKLAALTGNVLWQTNQVPISDVAFDGGQPTGVIVGPDNNPIVTGFMTVDGKIVTRTVKYEAAGASGNAVSIWDAVDDGNGFETTRSRAMAADGGGNFVVVGESENKDGNLNIYVAGYDGSTGGRTFRLSYPGTFGGDDLGIGIATDDYGNVAALGDANTNKGTGIGFREFVTLRLNRFIALTGDSLPDGIPGIASGALFTAGGAPAVNDNGQVVARVTTQLGKKKTNAILFQGQGGNTTFPAIQGQPAPSGTDGSTFASFADPLIESTGKIAFAGKMSGVPKSQSSGVWTTLSGNLTLALQQGAPVSPAISALPEKITSIMSLSLRPSQLLALVKVAGPAASNTVLLSLSTSNVGTVLLRTGAEVTVDGAESRIKTLTVLSPAAKSPGDGRWHADGTVVAKVGLQDGRTVLYRIADGAAMPMLFSGGNSPFVVDGSTPTWKTFGLPAVNSGATRYAALGQLAPLPGKVTKNNDSGLVFSPNGTTFAGFASTLR